MSTDLKVQAKQVVCEDREEVSDENLVAESLDLLGHGLGFFAQCQLGGQRYDTGHNEPEFPWRINLSCERILVASSDA